MSEQEQQQNNRPADTLRDGPLKVTLWERKSEHGAYYNANLTKTYKDKDGEFQETTSMTGAEMLRGSNLLTRAYDRMRELKSPEKQQKQKRGR